MEVQGAFFCDSAYMDQTTGKMNVVGIYNEIGSKYFPTHLKITSFVVLLEKSIFEDPPKEIHVDFIDEDGRKFYASETYTFEDNSKPDKNKIYRLTNLTFNTLGVYAANIFVDGNFIKSAKLIVKKDYAF
ncbi:DUF6941 family protein [Clostridium pasteurianum]|uniref:Uncharacterized protein n=1 Tax=Clostridium pasteurianum BC1 TaxID=86416 RepID=R4K2C6_CLOPA|nr:hypothetical protein [Clostridium pasteurianum]AGK96728.1 hypothetical protein Clopa_1826 [Clostridium pasteurianum BC1]